MNLEEKLQLWENALKQETEKCEGILSEIRYNVINKKISNSRKLFELLLKFGNNRYKNEILSILKLLIAVTDPNSPERKFQIKSFSIAAFNSEDIHEFIELIEIDDKTAKIHYEVLASTTLYTAHFADRSRNITKTMGILKGNMRKILEHFYAQNVSSYFEKVSWLLDKKFQALSKLIVSLQPPIIVDFIKYTVCETMKQLSPVEDDQNMLIFLNLVNFIMMKSKISPMFVDLCKSLVSSAENVFTSSTHKICLYLLSKFINFMTVTDADNGKELCSKLYRTFKRICDNQDILNSTVILETVCILSRNTAKLDNLEKIEMTSSFAQTYVSYCNNMTKVLRNYPNTENNIDCQKCSFVRRHVTFHLLNTIQTVFNVSLKLGILNSQLTIPMWLNFEYRFNTITSINCESRDLLLERNLCTLYQSLLVLAEYPNRITTCFQIIKNIMRLIMKTFQLIKTERIKNTYLLSFSESILSNLNIKDHLEEMKWFLQVIVAYYLSTGNVSNAMRFLAIAQEQFDCSDFDLWKLFIDKENDVCYLIDKNFDTADVIVCEMKTINRYTSSNRAKLVGMFRDLMNYTKDNLKLAIAMQCLDDAQLMELDQKVILNIRNEILKIANNKENNVEINSSLALIYYHLFIQEYNQLKDKLIKIPNIDKNDPVAFQQIAKEITVKDESRLLQNMTKCLKYVNKLANCWNPTEKDRVLSLSSILYCISTIGMEFFLRNSYAKAIESYIVVQRLAIDERYSNHLLMALIFLLDHYQFLPENLMATELEEKIKKANAIVETFDSVKEKTQTSYIIYLISLVTYYSRVKNYVDRDKAVNQFKKLMTKFVASGSSNVHCINACYYLNECRIIMADDSIRAEYLITYMKHAVYEINNSHNCEVDFRGFMQILWLTLVREAVNLFLNTSFYDYEIKNALCSVLGLARRLGSPNQYSELLVFCNLWSLVNEEMDQFDHYMNELKALMNITDLDEIPNIEQKPKASIFNANENIVIDFARESVVPPESATKFKIFNNSDISPIQTTTEKIKSLFHPTNCNCDHCREPQMKFRLFQIGCMFSRKMFIDGQIAVCESVNKHALVKWDDMRLNYIPKIADKIEMAILKKQFMDFSLRWIMECVDVSMSKSNYNDVGIYMNTAKFISQFTVNNPYIKAVLVKEDVWKYCQVTDHQAVIKKQHKSNVRKHLAELYDKVIPAAEPRKLFTLKPPKPKYTKENNEKLLKKIILSDSSDDEVDQRVNRRKNYNFGSLKLKSALGVKTFSSLKKTEIDESSDKLSKLGPGTSTSALPTTAAIKKDEKENEIPTKNEFAFPEAKEEKKKTVKTARAGSSKSTESEIKLDKEEAKKLKKIPSPLMKSADKVTTSKPGTSKTALPKKILVESDADNKIVKQANVKDEFAFPDDKIEKEEEKKIEKKASKTTRAGSSKSTESKKLEDNKMRGKEKEREVTRETKTEEQKKKLDSAPRAGNSKPRETKKPNIKDDLSFSEDEVEAQDNKKVVKKSARTTRPGTSKSKDSDIVAVDDVKISSRPVRTRTAASSKTSVPASTTPPKRTLRKKLTRKE